MKYLLSALLLISCIKAFSQNEITTPTGQPLKVGLLNLTSGSLMLNGVRNLSTAGSRNIFLGESSGSTTISGADNVFLGYSSGNANTTGMWNTYVGSSTGLSNTIGAKNVFIGGLSGYSNVSGIYNTFVGYKSGYNNSTGKENTFIGTTAGENNTTGNYNVFLGGTSTGTENTTGSANVFVGNAAGAVNTTGNNNIYVGAGAGLYNTAGSGNVFLGFRAGMNSLESNKLIVSNTDVGAPLIYGDFSVPKLIFNGQVGAGTSNFPTSVTLSAADGGGQGNTSAYKLFVKGGILTEQLIIASGWADYVFDKNYKLRPLSEVEQYIRHNGHLPNVPSAVTVGKTGIDVGDMTRIQQEKIEELTLYLIEMEKKMDIQNQEVKKQNQEMKKRDLDIKKQDQEIKMLRELVMQFTQKNNK